MSHLFKLIFCFLFFTLQLTAKNAIVQKNRGERLGDRLLIICATKFLALTHDLDFYYRTSPFLDNCMLSDTEIKFDNTIQAHYNKIISFNEKSFKQAAPSTLFTAPWSCIDSFCNNFGKRHLYRTQFDLLQAMVTPKDLTSKLEITPHTISVAVHIRKGEGYDQPLSSIQIYRNSTIKGIPADRSWPNKFPPEQYYIDQICRLEDLLANKKITFFIFTDSLKPQDLTDRIAIYCAKENVSFINASKSLNDSPLVDMYKMATCDCLIRAESAYSIVSQIMGNHKLVFSPKHCAWHGNMLHIEQVKITIFDSIRNWATECTYEQCDKTILQQWINTIFASC
jgi:hypothetical protein